MEIQEILSLFFTTLGMIWFFLIVLTAMSRRSQIEKIEVNGLQINTDNIIYAHAEYVEQGSFKGYLIFEKEKNNFLVQGVTTEDCKEELKKRFPDKTFFISGFNGGSQ